MNKLDKELRKTKDDLFLEFLKRENAWDWTIREMTEYLGFKSTRSVYQYLQRLRNRNLIEPIKPEPRHKTYKLKL